jgi:hypothetical protein
MIAPSTVPSAKLPHVPSSCCSNRRGVPGNAGSACQAAACPAIPCRPRDPASRGPAAVHAAGGSSCRPSSDERKKPRAAHTGGPTLLPADAAALPIRHTPSRASRALPITARPCGPPPGPRTTSGSRSNAAGHGGVPPGSRPRGATGRDATAARRPQPPPLPMFLRSLESSPGPPDTRRASSTTRAARHCSSMRPCARRRGFALVATSPAGSAPLGARHARHAHSAVTTNKRRAQTREPVRRHRRWLWRGGRRVRATARRSPGAAP